jgi:hypothetical protein
MHAPDVQPTLLIRVNEEGRVATDQPELVSAMALARGEEAGDETLAGAWPMTRQSSGPWFGQLIPSAMAVVVG